MKYKFDSHDRGYFVFLAHMVEQQIGNPWVVGSIPAKYFLVLVSFLQVYYFNLRYYINYI